MCFPPLHISFNEKTNVVQHKHLFNSNFSRSENKIIKTNTSKKTVSRSLFSSFCFTIKYIPKKENVYNYFVRFGSLNQNVKKCIHILSNMERLIFCPKNRREKKEKIKCSIYSVILLFIVESI